MILLSSIYQTVHEQNIHTGFFMKKYEFFAVSLVEIINVFFNKLKIFKAFGSDESTIYVDSKNNFESVNFYLLESNFNN